MDDEAEIGFIESHTEGRRRHQSFDPIGEQVGFELLPLAGVGRAGVGRDVVTQIAQQCRDVAGSGDGQCIDDARTVERTQLGTDPCDPLGFGADLDHRQMQ